LVILARGSSILVGGRLLRRRFTDTAGDVLSLRGCAFVA
jgi:hypothetical protein